MQKRLRVNQFKDVFGVLGLFLKNERKTKKVPKKEERHDDQHFFG